MGPDLAYEDTQVLLGGNLGNTNLKDVEPADSLFVLRISRECQGVGV